MASFLFIKTSSLGDVIHHMPAVTDARLHFPDAHLTWVVERPYVPLVKLHPAVDEIIPVSSRTWRHSLLSASTQAEMRDFGTKLRARTYDAIVDTQGLIRTGLISRVARGRRHGYDFGSIREPLASWFYDVRHKVSKDDHVIDRNRDLTAFALGYVASGDPDYGITRPRIAGGYTMFLHGTGRASKQWLEKNWIGLGRSLPQDEIVIPWGSEEERERAQRIARAVPNARVLDRTPMDGMIDVIAGASFVVGLDTGLLHLAAAFGVPLVAVFPDTLGSDAAPMGLGRMAIAGTPGRSPTVADVTAAVERVRSMPAQ